MKRDLRASVDHGRYPEVLLQVAHRHRRAREHLREELVHLVDLVLWLGGPLLQNAHLLELLQVGAGGEELADLDDAEELEGANLLVVVLVHAAEGIVGLLLGHRRRERLAGRPEGGQVDAPAGGRRQDADRRRHRWAHARRELLEGDRRRHRLPGNLGGRRCRLGHHRARRPRHKRRRRRGRGAGARGAAVEGRGGRRFDVDSGLIQLRRVRVEAAHRKHALELRVVQAVVAIQIEARECILSLVLGQRRLEGLNSRDELLMAEEFVLGAVHGVEGFGM
mmetsp:Transcript_135221/g.432244  ORF Transcript_135221/g.432244 Transcript_135221/m.432244 type:complete len:279 (-) Transcript_135221:4257-5093(-)